ncbi:MAG: DUF4405 domain-containing protein [Anaerolineales bacterium]
MKTKTNFVIDFIIFMTFLIVSEPALTGLAWHEWIGLAFFGTIVVHLLLHWDWVIQVSRRYFRNLLHTSRLNYVIDFVLLVAFVMIGLSGLMISRTLLPLFGIHFTRVSSWRLIHNFSANLMLFLVAIHFAMHWKWIVHQVKRFGDVFAKRQPGESKLQPAVIRVENEDFPLFKSK